MKVPMTGNSRISISHASEIFSGLGRLMTCSENPSRRIQSISRNQKAKWDMLDKGLEGAGENNQPNDAGPIRGGQVRFR